MHTLYHEKRLFHFIGKYIVFNHIVQMNIPDQNLAGKNGQLNIKMFA